MDRLDSWPTIIRAMEGVHDQLERLRRFSEEELHNLEVLWELLDASRTRTPPPSQPPSPRGPISPLSPLNLSSFRSLGGSEAPYSPAAGPPYPPSGGAGNLSSGRGLNSNNATAAANDLIPPPPLNPSAFPFSGALGSDPSPAPNNQTGTLSRSGAGTGTGMGGAGVATTNSGNSWSEGNTLVNQRGCCPHCKRAIYVRVTSGMQAVDSSYTEAVLRFRIHILSLQEMLNSMPSYSSSSGCADTNTGTGTGTGPPFSSTPLPRSPASPHGG